MAIMCRCVCQHLIMLCAVISLVCSLSLNPGLSLNQRSINDQRNCNTGLFLAQDDDASDLRERLTSVLSQDDNDKYKLPCGLECTDKEHDLIANIVSKLQGESNNLVTLNNGKIDPKLLVGEWNLLYTSSRAMIINKSLSGLGRSTAAKFSSLTQKLTGSKYLGFVELVERFDTGSEKSSFDVSITGEWMAEDEYKSLSGFPKTAVRFELKKIVWGGTANDAELWDSLGPIKLLDIVYFADGLQILRGNINTDSIFVFQKIEK